MPEELPPPLYSPKDYEKTLAYCVAMGAFGAHYYYVGRHIAGTVLCLLTVVICVGLGGMSIAFILEGRLLAGALSIVVLMVLVAVWPLFDFIRIQCSRFTDRDGLLLVPAERRRG